MFSAFVISLHCEMRKNKRNYRSKLSDFISLFVWPALIYFSVLFTYHVFDLSNLAQYNIFNIRNLELFLISGALGYYCFWAIVQNALNIQLERENGTIEIVFLSPANRLALLYGRALGNIIQSFGLFISFSIVIIVRNTGISGYTFISLLFTFFLLLVSSVLWGGLIYAIFILSRNVNFWFTLFDEPMNLFTGVKIPISSFPTSIQVISFIFPLTYCLFLIRYVLGIQSVLWKHILLYYIFSSSLVFIVTVVLLTIAEKRNRQTGNLQFY